MTKPIEAGWYETLAHDIVWDVTCPARVYDEHRQPRNTASPKVRYYTLSTSDWREVKKLPRALFVRYPLERGITPDMMTLVIERHYGWYVVGVSWAAAAPEPWNASAKDARDHGVKTAWIREGRLVWR